MNPNTNTLEKKADIQTNTETRQLILFKVGEQCYALLIEEVSEVLATPMISKLPLAPDYIKGLSNVRGNIYTLIDLEIRFQLENKIAEALETDDFPFTLLLNTQHAQVGILLRQVPDTLEVSEDMIDQAPLLIRENQSDKSYVRGIIRHEEKLVLLLDSREFTENMHSKS